MRILVAEENATSRDGALAALCAAGHAVVAAASGLEAWIASQSERFDVAFVSLTLPDLDGLALASLWRQEPLQSPRALVMMGEQPAAGQQRLWSELCRLAPAPEILTRPFVPALLAEVAEVAGHG